MYHFSEAFSSIMAETHEDQRAHYSVNWRTGQCLAIMLGLGLSAAISSTAVLSTLGLSNPVSSTN